MKHSRWEQGAGKKLMKTKKGTTDCGLISASSDSYSLWVPFSAWLSLEERARRLATAELGATGATGDVGRLADPGRYSELWFISLSPSRQNKVMGEVLIDADFLYACLNYGGSLCVAGWMCYWTKAYLNQCK